MVDIIRLHGDPHEQTQRLLPWYANGTLEGDEAAVVEAHLPECAECRTDLRLERALGREIASLPTDAAHGWASLRERLEEPGRTSLPAPRAFLRRPVPIGWALAAQAASLVLIVGLAWTATRPSPPRYVALGAPATAAPGNVVVIFNPTTSEQDLRGAVVQSGARIVDGPTASDAYVLHVDAGSRAAALTRLRSDAHVALAEPIDADARP